jgi:hypothetical protein
MQFSALKAIALGLMLTGCQAAPPPGTTAGNATGALATSSPSPALASPTASPTATASPSPSLAIALERASAPTFEFAAPSGWRRLLPASEPALRGVVRQLRAAADRLGPAPGVAAGEA